MVALPELPEPARAEMVLDRLARIEGKLDTLAEVALLALSISLGILTFLGAYALGVDRWPESATWLRLAMCGGGAVVVARIAHQYLIGKYRDGKNPLRDWA